MDPRETELEATIGALKALDPAIVGGALEKVEREMAGIRHESDTAATTAAVNSASMICLLKRITSWDLESPDTPEQREGLTDIVRLAPVGLTTRQHPTRTFGGKPVVVLDRAFLRRGTQMEESIPAEELPLFGSKGSELQLCKVGSCSAHGQDGVGALIHSSSFFSILLISIRLINESRAQD